MPTSLPIVGEYPAIGSIRIGDGKVISDAWVSPNVAAHPRRPTTVPDGAGCSRMLDGVAIRHSLTGPVATMCFRHCSHNYAA